MLRGMLDHSFQTRDGTHSPCIGSAELTTLLPVTEVPVRCFEPKVSAEEFSPQWKASSDIPAV